ncbi:hypothetical protein [Mangrovibacterium sp.]|uniref:hypothetical protein n=1 Tax=Mangrovibacterium sp. TaxID=1961364 RepID=UPI003569EDD2
MEYGKYELISNLLNSPREGWTNKKIKDLIDSLWRDPVLMRWSGFWFAGAPDTVLNWDNGAKLFSIAPTGYKFAFFQFRNKLNFHIKNAIETIDISEIISEGLYIFYFDFDPEKNSQKVFSLLNPTEEQKTKIYETKTVIAHVYWDATNNEALHFGDDRHGSEWQPQMHMYLHEAFHARRKSGLVITGSSFGGDGSDNAHAKFSVVGGVMLHDDFELTIASSSDSLPILYQQGFVPRYHNVAGYAIYKGASRICFNTGGAVVQADDMNYVLYHIFATNEIGTASRKIISVMGSAQYTSLADAYAAAPAELDALDSWMPQQGRLHIDTIVVRTSDSYTNDAAAIIVGVIGDTHPPVTIAENSKQLLEITDKQELSIPGEFEADEFYAIKNRIWQKITAGGGGTDGRGIVSIVLTSTVGLTKTYTITYTDATTSTFTVQDGEDGDDGVTPVKGVDYFDGDDGRGIASIVLHTTVGLTKTYRITFTDATTFDFDVKDGEDGEDGGGTGGAAPPELHLDFEEAGDEFVYNVPYNMKFTSMVCEGTDATVDIALNTDMPRYTKLTITATAAGLVSLYGVFI